MRWDTLSLWLKIPSDEGRTFEQDEMLIAPDGTMVSHTKQQFSMATRIQRNLTTVFGFPVGQVGEYSLEMKLKDMANEGVFIFETSFPLTVGHLATAQSGNT